jgi:hypothetical protein
VGAIYHELIAQGASTVEALGIMANMIAESSFNTQAVGDQGTSFGLVQQHGNYSYLVTGNPQQDMIRQIATLKSLGGFHAASGNTPQEAAGNFAANYERCVGCQPGGAQYNSRVGNANTVVGYFKSGKWPNTGGGDAQSAALTSASGGGGGGGFNINDLNPLHWADEALHFLTSGGLGLAGSVGGVFAALSQISTDFNTIVNDIHWLFVPSHWVRILAFGAGAAVLIPGLYELGHAGQGTTALPVGILLTVLAGVLFFVAFHNLDPSIHDLRSLLTALSAQIRGEPHAVAAQ